MGWEITSTTAIELLRKLDQTGSINSAAKAVGLSYKSAWQKLEALNNIVPYPLLNKQTGGSGGGGTVLTDEGRQLLRHVKLLEKESSWNFSRVIRRMPSIRLKPSGGLR